jgi:hypothetical protein
MSELPSDEMCERFQMMFNNMDSMGKCKMNESYTDVACIITASGSGKNLDKIIEERYIVSFFCLVDRNGFGPDGYNFTHHDHHGIDRWGKKTGTPFKSDIPVFREDDDEEYEYQFGGNTVTG